MERIIDKPYFTYSVYTALSSGLNVKCPKCHGFGYVIANDNTVFSGVQIVDIQKKKTVQFIVMMCIINVNAVDGIIEWIFKMRTNSTFKFSMLLAHSVEL